MARPTTGRHRTAPREATATAVLVLSLSLATPGGQPRGTAGASPASPRPGAPGMLEPHTSSLLVGYYETFLRDQDIEAFCKHVSARYTEGTLARMVASGDTTARRAAVLALGMLGGYQNNAAVARALRDGDPVVRSLASNALWAIWFRADTPEHNATLERVRDLIGQRRLEQAVALATRLIADAPDFAEAYNQRAIAYFVQGAFEDSAADCRRTLDRNPFHFGALSGLAQCQLRLNQRRDALKTLRRALRLQPHSPDLRQAVASLEAEGL